MQAYFLSPFSMGFTIFFVVAVLFLVIFLLRSVYLVKQAETLIIERLGRYSRILGPGSTLWSFIDPVEGGRYYRYTRMIYRIDLREAVYDFPKQNVITKDNVTMEINALLYYQITDAKAAIYEVANLPEAIEKLTQTTLRNVIGSMDLDESLVSRDKINERLRIILDEATDKWGVKVNRVELQEVNPPPDIRQAMEKQMRAERERREMILRAEGKKRSAILEAEGARESSVLIAEGDAQARVINAESQANARVKIAEAEAQVINVMKKSVPSGDPLPYLLATQYIKTLPEVLKGKEGKTVVVPYEATSLTGALVSMKKVFEG